MNEHIPTYEIINDLIDAAKDVDICQRSIRAGVLQYGNGKSTRLRLIANLQHIRIMVDMLEERLK